MRNATTETPGRQDARTIRVSGITLYSSFLISHFSFLVPPSSTRRTPSLDGVKIIYITTVDLSLRFLVLESMQHLKSMGANVIGVSAPGPHLREVREAGIPVITTPMTRRITPLHDLRSLLALVKLLKRERPDIVHTHTPKGSLLGQLAAWMAGVPVRVSTVHGLYFTRDTPPVRRFIYQAMETATALFSQRVFFINREDAHTARAFRISAPRKIRLLPGGLGIDLEQYDPAQLDRDELCRKRSQLGLADDALVVGYVGRLVREKGLVELMEAFKQFAAIVPEARLLVVGPYDAEKPDSVTPEVANDYGIADKTVFTGMRTDTVDLYGLIDIFVLPSYREGMPRSVMEAQAMGLPVITTDARGCHESILDGETGLIVPTRDARALAEALQKLAGDGELRRSMGEAGRKFAARRYDQQSMFRVIGHEYSVLLRRHARKRR
ncbi:MAG: glycosyltransferase family 4 protein [Chloroflexota bacterium]